LVGTCAGAHTHSGAVGHPGLVETAVGFNPLVTDPEPGNRRGQAEQFGQIPNVGYQATDDT